MSRVVTKAKCSTCGGNIIDDVLDERTYCLQCGRGIDHTKTELPRYSTVGEGRQYSSEHYYSVAVLTATPDRTAFYKKHPLH